jgi:hypothetical protein
VVVSLNGQNAPEGTRTPNLLIRSQMLYPIELRAPELRTATANNPNCELKWVFAPQHRVWAVQDSNL